MSDAPAALSDSAKSEEQTDEKLHEVLEAYRDKLGALKAEVGRIFIGPESTVESLLVALLARGHILLEGVPGVAKTTLVRAFARTLRSDFKRIQFTPDLLPADITGTYIPNLQTNEFVLRKGPIFANVLLGDEINRAPAKTQSALLEAMQERQVTIEGQAFELKEPFMVLATQNPLEQEGTYPLPEAELDRFLFKVLIEYPDESHEQALTRLVLDGTIGSNLNVAALEPVVDTRAVPAMRAALDAITLDEAVLDYAVRLARASRDLAGVERGASPRASIALVQAGRAHALMEGREYVTPDDIKAVAPPVLRHRMQLSADAEIEGQTPETVLGRLLEQVEAPRQ